MKKTFIKIITVISIISCIIYIPASVSADSTVTTSAQPAAEYISDDMFENYETVSSTAGAVAASVNEISVTASSAILMEASTGKILYEKEPDTKRPPASITKIMTMILVMEAIESGKMKYTDILTASAHAVSMGGSQIWLKEGEKMSVKDLLKATAVASANDASVVLGEAVAGSEEAFVAKMNQRAKELGMKNTTFLNCCGLDLDGHTSTARDIAIMARELLKHSAIREYSGIWMDYLRDGQTQLVNTNKMVRFYEGATGLKTGTTSKAGYCVCASAKRDSMELIAVILNGSNSNQRFTDAKTLLNYGFANYSIFTPDISNLNIHPIAVSKGTEKELPIANEKVTPILIEKGTEKSIETNVSIPDEAQAPVTSGQLMGKITFTCKGKVLGECRLYAQNDIPEMTFIRGFLKILSALTQL